MSLLDHVGIALAIGIALLSAVLALVVRDFVERGRDSDARFREFAEAMPHVVFTMDIAGVVLFANSQFAKLTGAQAGAALGSGFLEFIHPDDQERMRALRTTGLSAGIPVALEYRLRTTDGYRWRLMRLIPKRDRAGTLTGWYGTATDIDDVKRESARAREQAALLDQVREAIVVLDLQYRVRHWSRGAERMYGWTLEEVRDRSVMEFLYRSSPEALAAVSRIANGAEEFSGRLPTYGKDGVLHVVEAHCALVRDEAGLPASVIATHLDITDRVKLQEQLEQAMRLEAVGELSGGLAHDFNNLLTVILGNSELLVSRLGAEPRLRALAEMTRGAAQRGAALTQRMLAFARRQVLDPKALDVGELLRGMRSILTSTLREDIVLTIRADERLWRAEVDRTQLENAIVSLCANARDALTEGGTVQLNAVNVDLSAADAVRPAELAPGRYVRIDVADNGVGIAPEVIGRVFDPFFTTKERSKGTGLGLSMVYGFAKQSGGHASIESTPGAGTTVSLFLPMVEMRASAPRVDAEPSESGGEAAGETVLITEDDDLVRAYVCEQVESLGYKVERARDAKEALRLLGDGRHVDLLFTDIVMPGGMNGHELADAARTLRPGLAVLFTSGYPEDALGSDGRLGPGVQLLGKPYRRATLAQKLRTALAPRGPSDLGAQ